MTMVFWSIVLASAGSEWKGAAAPEDAVLFSATLRASSLEVGNTYDIEVVARPNEQKGYRLAGRRPIPLLLQMKSPESVVLEPVGEPDDGHLRPPHEVAVKGGRRRIRFRLRSAPQVDDALVINLVGYVEGGSNGRAWLVRRRGRVQIEAGATLVSEPATRSDWQDTSTLALGERAVGFKLPDTDGNLHDLARYAGAKNVLLVTYRAHW